MVTTDKDVTTRRTLTNIRKTLEKSLAAKYGITDKSVVDNLLNIHGLNNERFDFVKSIESVINEKLNDVSIDANSNKNEKTIEAVVQESIAPVKKAIGYDLLYREIKELYGKEEAKRLTGELYDLSLGLSDSTNIAKPYCWALNASNLVTIGRDFGQLHSKSSKRVSSYISALCETVHQMSSHLAGAIAIGSFFTDIAHLSLYGPSKMDLRELRTNARYRKKLENEFQQFVHSVNHLSRNGCESPFTNLSVFDRIKLRNMVEELEWYFPFDDLPIYHPKDLEEEDKRNFYVDYIVDYIMEIQEIFLDFFDKGDPLKNGSPYRFPVVTLNLAKKKWGNKEIIEDQKFLQSVCRRDIFRYNIFVSEGSKIASCCFDKDQKILVRNQDGIHYDTFENIFKLGNNGKNTRIYHNGSWSFFKRVKVPYSKDYYKITTANNKVIMVTEDHLNPTLRGDTESRNLTCDDYLMFSTRGLESISKNQSSKKDEDLTYEQGYLIGCFLGDGSYGVTDKDGNVTQTSLSLNENCFYEIKEKVDKALTDLGIDRELKLSSVFNNVYPATLNSKYISKFIKEWVIGRYSYNKELNLEVLNQPYAFRKGILDGWYITDGGNSNRCSSSSSRLIETMEVLCTSLGLNTIIDVTDRTDEKVIIRGEEFNRNYPLWCLRWYSPSTKRSMKNVYKVFNNSVFFKIKSIEKVKGSSEAYCVEITQKNSDEPYFTLPNGIITHNCRLLSDSDMVDLASQANSFGGGGSVSLGSHRVCTINFMRLALESSSAEEFSKLLSERVESTAKILKAHKQLLQKLTDQGLQQFISNGWIAMERMFSTFGMLGIYEGAKLYKEKFGNDRDIVKDILIEFNQLVTDMSAKYGIIGNIEQIPGESFAIRTSKADKNIYSDEQVPYKLYANQFIPLWEDATIWEKMDEDGKYNQLITGGGIVHIQIGEKVTAKQAEKIIRYSVNSGCEHFALNSVWSECSKGHTLFGKHSVCTECSSEIVEYYTRIVGFFTPVSSWQDIRRDWEFGNRTFSSLPKD